MLGYTAEEFLTIPGFGVQLVHEEDRERVIREGDALARKGGSIQFRWIAKDGRVVWAEAHMDPILDEAGTAIGVRGVTLDITEQKLAEFARGQSEERNRAILQAIPDVMFLQTRDGLYLDYHAQRRADLPVPPEEFLFKNMRDVLPPQLASDLSKCFENAEEEDAQILEYELPVNGDERWFEARVVRSGENILSVVRDVTARKTAENALKQNEAQLAGIIGSAMDGIITVNDHQEVVLFNAAAEKMFGCSAAKAIGQPLDRFIPERLRHGTSCLVSRTCNQPRDGFVRRFKWTQGESGEEFPIEASISEIELNGEKFYTVILRDITDRKRAEEQRRESEARFRILADSSPVLIWVNGLHGCEFVNRSYMEFLGRSMDEVLSMDWTTVLHPEDLETYVATYQRAFEKREQLETQFRFRRFDGEYRWFKSIGVPRFTFEGEFLGYVGSSVDVTDIKNSEEALRQSEARFKNMADTAPVMIWIAGTDKLCTYFNKPWLDFTGRTMDQELGNGWAEDIHPDDYARCLETYRLSFRTQGALQNGVQAAAGRMASIAGFLILVLPAFRHSREFLGYIGSCIDITDRREAEEELRQGPRRIASVEEPT